MGKKANHNEKLETLYIVSQKQKDEVHNKVVTHNPSIRVHMFLLGILGVTKTSASVC